MLLLLFLRFFRHTAVIPHSGGYCGAPTWSSAAAGRVALLLLLLLFVLNRSFFRVFSINRLWF